MSVFAHILIYIALAVGTVAWRVSRAVLLQRAGSAALKHGSKDPHGEAGLAIVKALTDEPWYRAILPGGRSGDGKP